MQRHLLFILLSLPMLPACDDNVDAQHKGKPLFSLGGEVLAPANDAAPTGDLQVVLAWQADKGDGDFIITEEVDVSGNFPAAFDLNVYNPPPEAALNRREEGDPGVAISYILAMPTSGTFSEEAIQGAVEDHVLAYVAADIAGDSPLGARLGFSLKAGFHLLQVTPATAEDLAEHEACVEENTSDCEYPFDRLTPVPFGTPLNLVLGDSETLHLPNFT